LPKQDLTSLEVCAGAGGQALGLERAGFDHVALVENDHHACLTLRHNRPSWDVREEDLIHFDGSGFRGDVRLLAGGVPCPPFSIAGKQLGADDDRDLMPHMVRLAEQTDAHAVLIENVRGILSPRFDSYRDQLRGAFQDLGYVVFDWTMLHASKLGVPQLRPRVMLVAMKEPWADFFLWPDEADFRPPATVGETLLDLMAAGGWELAQEWADQADRIAPTLVGGSKKHGGPDLGPTRAKRAWADMGVDGMGIADAPPSAGFVGKPKLTVTMAARLQGFPDVWEFVGRKTHAYRQVGNALPPPVAEAVGLRIKDALLKGDDR
jgi:DNA (cytosine-5)-methyltransferase 1